MCLCEHFEPLNYFIHLWANSIGSSFCPGFHYRVEMGFESVVVARPGRFFFNFVTHHAGVVACANDPEVIGHDPFECDVGWYHHGLCFFRSRENDAGIIEVGAGIIGVAR